MCVNFLALVGLPIKIKNILKSSSHFGGPRYRGDGTLHSWPRDAVPSRDEGQCPGGSKRSEPEIFPTFYHH